MIIVSGTISKRVFRFDADSAALQLLKVADRRALELLDEKLREVFPRSTGDYLVLLADRALVEANYADPHTLIWRDAGALMQTLHFCASVYRLAFCPAGITGRELTEALFGSQSRMLGVGAAVVGRPPVV